jgi:hypothetical protein
MGSEREQMMNELIQWWRSLELDPTWTLAACAIVIAVAALILNLCSTSTADAAEGMVVRDLSDQTD